MGKVRRCICGEDPETIEHIIQCEIVQSRIRRKGSAEEWIKYTENGIKEIKEMTEYIKKYIKERDQMEEKVTEIKINEEAAYDD